jgi:hypothetical protein
MTLIAELINHFVNGIVKMAKIKKAQLGDHLVKRKSQDDRIHRIEKKDPERAERVSDRVQKRALRSVKPSSVKPPSKMFIPLRERAKAAKERKAAEAPKAQSGDSLVYETKGVRYPKRRLAVDTAGYAGGKKTFKGTGRYLEGLESGVYKDYPAKPKKYGRKIVKSIINAKSATPKKRTGGNVTKKKIVKK